MSSGDDLMRFAHAADAIHGGIHYAFLAAGELSTFRIEDSLMHLEIP
jgi:hypothetical protein